MNNVAIIAALQEANRVLVAENARLRQEIADLRTQIHLLKDKEARRNG